MMNTTQAAFPPPPMSSRRKMSVKQVIAIQIHANQAKNRIIVQKTSRNGYSEAISIALAPRGPDALGGGITAPVDREAVDDEDVDDEEHERRKRISVHGEQQDHRVEARRGDPEELPIRASVPDRECGDQLQNAGDEQEPAPR